MHQAFRLACLLAAAAAAVWGGAGCTRADMSASTSETAPELAASGSGPLDLGHEPLAVVLRVSADKRERLAALAAAARPGSVRLLLEGIEALHPGAVYAVHLEPAGSEAPAASAPSFVGHLAPFGGAGPGPETTRGFDVTQRVRALWGGTDAGKGGPEEIRILLVPSDLAEGKAAGEPRTLLRVRRIALVERAPAGR